MKSTDEEIAYGGFSLSDWENGFKEMQSVYEYEEFNTEVFTATESEAEKITEEYIVSLENLEK